MDISDKEWADMSDKDWAIMKTKFLMLWKLKHDQEQLDIELKKPDNDQDKTLIEYLQNSIKLSYNILDPNY